MSRSRSRSRSKAAGPASLRDRLTGFLAERYPFAVGAALEALGSRLDASKWGRDDPSRALTETQRSRLKRALAAAPASTTIEASPGVTVDRRIATAAEELLAAVEGFAFREAVRRSLSPDEKVELLRGMALTRATDNQLKAFFLGSDVRYNKVAFQGKGFRSLGQEAIYGAALRLRRGPEFRDADGNWSGDVVAPLIRDLGVALAMRPDPEAVRQVLSAQMGKQGPPMDGKDFHIGDFGWGILPATAPLSIPSLTAAGMAVAFGLQNAGRVAVSFIGEGGSSLGEWHEAINLCAARRAPAVFCIQNNQTALSTPVTEQSSVRSFADKAAGYGIPGITVDGTDPEEIAASFAWAATRARQGLGPTLIELVSMRMCGHAHHDDMLYLGKEPAPGWDYPEPTGQGYADAERYRFWSLRDPLLRYSVQLEQDGLIEAGTLEELKAEAERTVSAAAREVVDAPWPEPRDAGKGVVANEPVREHAEPLENRDTAAGRWDLPALEPGPPFDREGSTFLEAVMRGVGDALAGDPRAFVYGEDVGGRYGNAFLLLRPLLDRFGDRILNSTLAEGGVLGVCVGAALAGLKPIGEIQFNDFVATGFNQLVNNAAKTRYRWGGSVPMVVRLPWGGLRRAGPYHSQNTEAWFYRTPGLKIVAPSTPHDALALMATAVADPDPVLYYEHIGLYRDPKIKQHLPESSPAPLPLGKAALRRAGADLAMISYGAFVHRAMALAETLAKDGIEASVLDLRSLAPLDRAAVLAVARHCGKVLVLHEDSRTGGIGESLAAIIQEEAFEWLDAPVRVVGALDAPVPYSPPLEDRFLPDLARLERAARLLVAY